MQKFQEHLMENIVLKKNILHKLEICQRWVNENYEIHTEEETVN